MELVKITYPADLPTSHVDRLAGLLGDAGVSAELTPAQTRKGGLHFDPLTVIITATAVGYFNTFAGELGRSSGAAVTQLVQRVVNLKSRAEHRPADGDALIVVIEDRNMVFVYPAELVGDADANGGADALMGDPTAAPGIYRWQPRQRKWLLS